MGIFRFKRFSVKNESSAMKVNTDGVLLGAVMKIVPEDRFFLDVGTGTGTVALMAAQRCEDLRGAMSLPEICIDAIDSDLPSAAEAGENFSASPWGGTLHAYNKSLEEFSADCTVEYDLIFSNPPYFDCSLQAPQLRRNAARHTASGLSYRELLEFSASRLSASGRLAVILPADQEKALLRHARMCSLFLFRMTKIRTVPRKSDSRIIAEFSRTRCVEPSYENLVIQNEGKYTSEYISLTKDFYLLF